MLSLASTLRSTASIPPQYVPSCTFSPRSRNRFACNTCKQQNGGGPILVKRSQIEGHRMAVFLRKNPRTKLPPLTRFEPEQSARARPRSRRGTRTKQITLYAESWLCPNCFERNEFGKNWVEYGPAGVVACGDCGLHYEIERGGV